MIEITSGLEDGDDVITIGQVGLKDDASVSVINATEEESEAAVANAPEEEGEAAVADGDD